MAPWDVMGLALVGPPWGLMGQALGGPPGPLWARSFWDPYILMGPRPGIDPTGFKLRPRLGLRAYRNIYIYIYIYVYIYIYIV